MTAAELVQKFNLHYDNILSAAAPGLNEYEISLFLTQAHREVVSSYYNGVMGGDPIDSTEAPKSLISRYILMDSAPLNVLEDKQYYGLYQYVVKLKLEVLQLLEERMISPSSTEDCIIDGTPVKLNSPLLDSNIIVKPIDIDEWLRLAPNPFRRPSDLRVWRMDITNNADTINREIRLVSSMPLANYTYYYTYMKEPEPIILVNLDEEPWTSIGDLSIMGSQKANVDDTSTTIGLDKQIPPTLWELIINRAVELATRDYKENNLNTQIALNRRVE